MKNIDFDFVLSTFVILFPLILLDIESEFLQKQSIIAVLLNFICLIVIFVFIKSLGISKGLSSLIIFFITLWFCILPLIFYKIYLKNPESFAYNKEYLLSQKQFHKNDFELLQICNSFMYYV